MVITQADIMVALGTIPDPEMPISIVDLGLVERVLLEPEAPAPGARRIVVDILPTFVGCPALPMIADDIRKKLGELDEVREVVVRFVYEPPWSVDRISEAGRASLKSHGVTVPQRSVASGSGAATGAGGVVQITISEKVPCPFCDSTDTRLDSPFGPTRCRIIYYCNACRNVFEHLKKV